MLYDGVLLRGGVVEVCIYIFIRRGGIITLIVDGAVRASAPRVRTCGAILCEVRNCSRCGVDVWF